MGFGLLSFVILVAIVLHRKLCDATPVVTLTLGTYNFKSGDKLELSCSVNETVDLFSVTFYQNTIQTIWINNFTTCSFLNLIPTDKRNYSLICDPSNTNFTMIKYGLNVSDDKAVWFCRMISKSGGSCPISNRLCTSSSCILSLQVDTTTGRPDIDTTTGRPDKEKVSHTGAIVGGCIGGIAVISISGGGVIFYRYKVKKGKTENPRAGKAVEGSEYADKK